MSGARRSGAMARHRRYKVSGSRHVDDAGGCYEHARRKRYDASANRESGDPMTQLLIGGALALSAVLCDQANLPAAAFVFAGLMVLWCAFEARVSR